MGQKIHPVGFRLGVSEDHHSIWFARANQYSTLLQQDIKIRACIQDHIKKYLKTSLKYGGIARIDIKYHLDLVHIHLLIAFPTLFGDEGNLSSTKSKSLDILRESLQSIVVNDKVKLTLAEIPKTYANATILAEYVALQLENRVAFRKTMKKAIELANEHKVRGVKIQISGRLNGAEIARIEWAREGRVPLHTLRAKIDYCSCPAQTMYGVLGIKIWIFQK